MRFNRDLSKNTDEEQASMKEKEKKQRNQEEKEFQDGEVMNGVHMAKKLNKVFGKENATGDTSAIYN